MKKYMPLLAVIVVSAALLGAVATMNRGFSVSVGRCVMAGNGSYLLVLDDCPVVLSRKNAGANPWMKLETGDKIMVVPDGIATSNPGQTREYFTAYLEREDGPKIEDEIMGNLGQ